MKHKYEEMLPHELEQALAEFAVAYVPFGSLEWHGRHLALGNDTLKAYGILLRTAEKYGGVVVPPTYWGHMAHWKPGCHPGLTQEIVDGLFEAIFRGLVAVGFKVVIGVTGHDVQEQIESLQKAVEAISAEGRAAGFAMMEGWLYDFPGDKMDHAAHWETSILMHLRPDLVQMARSRTRISPRRRALKRLASWGATRAPMHRLSSGKRSSSVLRTTSARRHRNSWQDWKLSGPGLPI